MSPLWHTYVCLLPNSWHENSDFQSIHKRIKFFKPVDPVKVVLLRFAVDDDSLQVAFENLCLRPALFGFRGGHDLRTAVPCRECFVSDVDGGVF